VNALYDKIVRAAECITNEMPIPGKKCIDLSNILCGLRYISFILLPFKARHSVLHSILIEFCIPMELHRLIKMCLKETYSKVYIVLNICLIHFLSRMV
jgi:hypothetical protein